MGLQGIEVARALLGGLAASPVVLGLCFVILGPVAPFLPLASPLLVSRSMESKTPEALPIEFLSLGLCPGTHHSKTLSLEPWISELQAPVGYAYIIETPELKPEVTSL